MKKGLQAVFENAISKSEIWKSSGAIVGFLPYIYGFSRGRKRDEEGTEQAKEESEEGFAKKSGRFLF